MKSILKNRILIVILVSLLLTSCSSVGLLDDNIPYTINSVGQFLKLYLVLQISILIVGLLLSLFLGKLGYIISLLLHFIWIVSQRDYGFFKVFLLFGLFSIISFVISKYKDLKRIKEDYDRYKK